MFPLPRKNTFVDHQTFTNDSMKIKMLTYLKEVFLIPEVCFFHFGGIRSSTVEPSVSVKIKISTFLKEIFFLTRKEHSGPSSDLSSMSTLTF